MIITTNDLTKKFGNFTAVDKLNIEIEEGEVFGLLGPNGAGKTTTISMLCTILKPTSGSAKVNGFDVSAQPSKVRSSIGIVFQEPSVDDLLTGRENLEIHAMLYKIPREVRKRRIGEVISLVGLEDRADDVTRVYSGGMRRRLELARGLMHHPKVLFLDEPTLGLDPQTREHIWDYIKKLSKEEEMTMVLTTHYMEEADMLCNRIAIMDAGKIVVLDNSTNLKKKVGGDIVVLKMDNPNLEKIRKLSFVTSAESKDGSVQIVIKDVDRNLQKLLCKVGRIKSVEVRPVTLNDVFIHYTGKEIRGGEEEGSYWDRIMRSEVNR
ncbi:MAG: ABC-type multidrug transport system, ATPase component [Candidatus Fermentimicrarchaeum limneticum]|uniref:ABC-type multidrug transport system, ATPase component n=1 Tax=Fermentimicrarchaeum limneticum TaxID=2795018 RepID=A0A7D5XJN0_FERL1|nr:MAG: ABC-type multidrug transport system, ATPase component [Candidatus Fermentimicrarchaeum limneticum]